ncbi:hypothetical protein GH714_028304 [Hevea brasiliensis]|uniref:Uncharacterized protein n=1 Tax=Hevea brasiliensis TaxID=3981 RepID=A0A6A6KUS7_HEVBR|nr:hypothetical protein GH714_028304 [Hevea brasiliensis]
MRRNWQEQDTRSVDHFHTTPYFVDSKPHEYISMRNLNESKQGFWGNLARKAKSILEDDNAPQQVDSPRRAPQHVPHASTKPKYQNPYPYHDSQRKTDSPTLQKGLNAISSSLNYVGNAVEEGLTKVENRTADIIQETRKHIRKKPVWCWAVYRYVDKETVSNFKPNTPYTPGWYLLQSRMFINSSNRNLKVAMAMAAKAKLLLRELKTVKADLAFAKERCAQLEEENKILRENRERGDNPEDDDLVPSLIISRIYATHLLPPGRLPKSLPGVTGLRIPSSNGLPGAVLPVVHHDNKIVARVPTFPLPDEIQVDDAIQQTL